MYHSGRGLGVLIMGETVHVWRRGHKGALYLPVNFAVNLKRL